MLTRSNTLAAFVVLAGVTLGGAAAETKPAATATTATIATIKALYRSVGADIKSKRIDRKRLRTSTVVPAIGDHTRDYTFYSRKGKDRTLAKLVVTYMFAASSEHHDEYVFTATGKLAFALQKQLTQAECDGQSVEVSEAERLYFAGGKLVRMLSKRRVVDPDGVDEDCAKELGRAQRRDSAFGKQELRRAKRIQTLVAGYRRVAAAVANGTAKRDLKRMMLEVEGL